MQVHTTSRDKVRPPQRTAKVGAKHCSQSAACTGAACGPSDANPSGMDIDIVSVASTRSSATGTISDYMYTPPRV